MSKRIRVPASVAIVVAVDREDDSECCVRKGVGVSTGNLPRAERERDLSRRLAEVALREVVDLEVQDGSRERCRSTRLAVWEIGVAVARDVVAEGGRELQARAHAAAGGARLVAIAALVTARRHTAG